MSQTFSDPDTEISLKVVRCGCGDPTTHANAVCPTPRKEHDLGVVDFGSASALKRLTWRISGKPAADRRIEEANKWQQS